MRITAIHMFGAPNRPAFVHLDEAETDSAYLPGENLGDSPTPYTLFIQVCRSHRLELKFTAEQWRIITAPRGAPRLRNKNRSPESRTDEEKEPAY